MVGTIINIVTVIVGSLLGIMLGGRFPERARQTVVNGLGLFTLALGLQMFLKTQDILVVLGSLLIGALLGEWWQIEDRLQSFGRLAGAKVREGGRGRPG